MTDKPIDNIIKFPTEAVRKFGFERVKERRSAEERHGQLNLFGEPGGEVVKLPTGVGAFDEALMLDEQGDNEAAESYRRAIEDGDCVADAYCNLGVMESTRGNTAKAFDCFTKSLEDDPRHYESHYNLGNLYFDTGDLRLARVHYEMAAEVEPDLPNVYFNLGLVSALSEELEKAVEALSRYKELAPDDEASKADELIHSLKLSISDKR